MSFKHPQVIFRLAFLGFLLASFELNLSPDDIVSAQERPGKIEDIPPPTDAEFYSTVDGAKLYRRLCENCHGANGAVPQEVQDLLVEDIPNLATDAFRYGDSFEQLKKTIAEGRGRSKLRYEYWLTPAQITELARYLMRLRGVSQTSLQE